MKSEPASIEVGNRTQLPALCTGLLLMVTVTADPRFVVDSTGHADHLLAIVVFWAMTAGFVRGVGFVPQTIFLRWVFGGRACALALIAAAVIKALRVLPLG